MDLRTKIIEGSLQQFLQHGIRKMTVQRLVARMGLSTKTVYKFFPGKEELLKECLQLHYAGLMINWKQLEQDAPNPVWAIFETWQRAINLDFGVNHIFYSDLNYYFPDLQDSTLKKIFSKQPRMIKNQIVKGIEEGYFHKEIDPDIVIVVMGVIYASITRTGQFKQFRISPKEIFKSTMEPYLRGLCTAKGLNLVESL